MENQITQTETIDGMIVSVSQLPYWKASPLAYRIAKVLLPALGKLGGAGTKLAEVDLEKIGEAAQFVFANLSENEFKQLQRDLLETTVVDGVPLLPVIDTKLQGKVFTGLKILVFAGRVNFADFFSALRVRGNAAAKAQPNPSTGLIT